MANRTWQAVDDYYAALFASDDPVMDGVLAASEAAGLPAIAVSPLQGRLLMMLAQAAGARRILEIGTLGGYSAIWLARALPPDGKLITLEAAARHAEVAEANVARAGFAGLAEVWLGPAEDSLKALAAAGAEPFDFVFIDANKEGYPVYLEWALKLTRPGSLIVADNMVREGKVADAASRDAAVKGVRHLNELLAASGKADATAVQTVGVRGYDGFVLARVTG